MIRAFIAVDIDDPKLLDELVRVRDLVLSSGAHLKPVAKENMHITLKFLGNISEALIDEIYKVMLGVEFTPFKVVVGGLGAFPNPRRPRVVWVGVKEGAEKLEEIFKGIERGLRRLGFRPEPKGFTPHITIARVKGGPLHRLTKIIDQLRDVELGVMEVRCIRLKQSTLTPRGPIYSTLKEVCRG